MNKISSITGRDYQLFDYEGAVDATHIIISMASSTSTISATIKKLNEYGNKYGLIKVRLFRPFSAKHLAKSLPKSCKIITVLDRTKEPGSNGEPLYKDICQSMLKLYQQEKIDNLPKIIGGRYGLSSKEFNPAMVKSIFKNSEFQIPKDNFTIGIEDDITNLSLTVEGSIGSTESDETVIFHEFKSKDSADNFNQFVLEIGKDSNTFCSRILTM